MDKASNKNLSQVGIVNPSIKARKPNLKLCGNHFKSGPRIYRIWNSAVKGTAYSDGAGWYRGGPADGGR
jgi:hypothetical protein